MEKPVIRSECVKPMLETKFIKVYDLQYAEGKHYYDATRRSAADLVAVKSDAEAKAMLPDAVSCFVVLRNGGGERLLLTYEYRYPIGRFLLSPPAGLIDPEDRDGPEPLLTAAKREIFEETGLVVKDTDEMTVVNPCVFSSPGMTDESNALVAAVLTDADTAGLTSAGAVGTECFEGFRLVTRAEAEEILRTGRDEHGMTYSVYTQLALTWFTGRK